MSHARCLHSHRGLSLTLVILALCLSTPVQTRAGLPFQLALGTAPSDAVATINDLLGEVEVFYPSLPESEKDPEWDWVNKERWVKAKNFQTVSVQQSIRTYKGRARLVFHDFRDKPPPPSGPSIFNIGENTEIAISKFETDIERFERKGVIDLIRGTISAFIRGWGQNSDFSVRAGVAVCGIRGTKVTLHYEPEKGRLLVEVQEGKVVITSPYGSRIVKQGQSTMFIHGKFSGGPS